MNESELKTDVRHLTGYSDQQLLSGDDLDSCLRRAKRHIRVQTGLDPTEGFFDSDIPQREEALFWYTALFVKVQTGELDSGTVAVGSVESSELLAKSDEEETLWYRNARNAMEGIANTSLGGYVVGRPDREYGYASGTQDGSGTEVDESDL